VLVTSNVPAMVIGAVAPWSGIGQKTIGTHSFASAMHASVMASSCFSGDTGQVTMEKMGRSRCLRRSPLTASIIASRYGTSSGSCTPPTIWKCFDDHRNDTAVSKSARLSVEASVGKTVDHITFTGSSASARSVDRHRSARVEVRRSPVFSSRVNDAWPSVM